MSESKSTDLNPKDNTYEADVRERIGWWVMMVLVLGLALYIVIEQVGHLPYALFFWPDISNVLPNRLLVTDDMANAKAITNVGSYFEWPEARIYDQADGTVQLDYQMPAFRSSTTTLVKKTVKLTYLQDQAGALLRLDPSQTVTATHSPHDLVEGNRNAFYTPGRLRSLVSAQQGLQWTSSNSLQWQAWSTSFLREQPLSTVFSQVQIDTEDQVIDLPDPSTINHGMTQQVLRWADQDYNRKSYWLKTNRGSLLMDAYRRGDQISCFYHESLGWWQTSQAGWFITDSDPIQDLIELKTSSSVPFWTRDGNMIAVLGPLSRWRIWSQQSDDSSQPYRALVDVSLNVAAVTYQPPTDHVFAWMPDASFLMVPFINSVSSIRKPLILMYTSNSDRSLWTLTGSVIQIEPWTLLNMSGSDLSIAMNARGTTMVVGIPEISAVYRLEKPVGLENSWTYVEKWEIDGISSLGSQVVVSADGNTVVMSAANQDNGKLYIYHRDLYTGTYEMVVGGLTGTSVSSGGKFGGVLSLSADGFTLAVGHDSDSLASVWIWICDPVTMAWSEQTRIVVGNNGGRVLCLSEDGQQLIVKTTQGLDQWWRDGSNWYKCISTLDFIESEQIDQMNMGPRGGFLSTLDQTGQTFRIWH